MTCIKSYCRQWFLFLSSKSPTTCFVTLRVVHPTQALCCGGSHRPKSCGKRIILLKRKTAVSRLYLRSSLKERSSQVQRPGNHTKQVTEQNAILLLKEWIGIFLFGFITTFVTIYFYLVTKNKRWLLLIVACGMLWSISMVIQRLHIRRMLLAQRVWQEDMEKYMSKLEERIEKGDGQLAMSISQLESIAKTCEWMERKQEERKEEWKQFLWEWKRLGEEWNESRMSLNTRLYQLDKWEERWKDIQSTLKELASNLSAEKQNWSSLSEQVNQLFEKVTLVSSENRFSMENKETVSSSISNGNNNVSGIVPWKESKGREGYSHLYSFSRDEFEREEMLKQLDEEWIDAYWEERDYKD
ncbi:uncharacterized protein Gasu_53460, partial [Galdieria sulphuraria]